MNATQFTSIWKKTWKPALGVLLLGALLAIGLSIWSVWSDLGSGQARRPRRALAFRALRRAAVLARQHGVSRVLGRGSCPVA